MLRTSANPKPLPPHLPRDGPLWNGSKTCSALHDGYRGRAANRRRTTPSWWLLDRSGRLAVTRRDGHSVLLVGFRDDTAQPGGGVFLIQNTSKGPRDGAMSYEYVRAYMNDAAWISYEED